MKASDIIRQSGEAMRRVDRIEGAFEAAKRQEVDALVRAVLERENALMMGEAVEYAVCEIPEFSGFDDPCDDWDDSYDEDYDY